MTTPSDNQIFESYVPVYDAIPEGWEDSRAFIVEQFRRMATAINIREIGWHLDEEVLTGKAFIPTENTLSDGYTSQQFRQVLRKVIDFGELPNATTKQVEHGININENFTLVQFYGSATDPSTLVGLPIPYANPTALNQSISLDYDSTYVIIGTGIDRTNYTRCYVVIEYLQEL